MPRTIELDDAFTPECIERMRGVVTAIRDIHKRGARLRALGRSRRRMTPGDLAVLDALCEVLALLDNVAPKPGKSPADGAA
jgi:hypothetical protein